MKGLICAGGEATRLQELTRQTNKHLLRVGPWPMIYYPLQLMQLLGIRKVLLVTGQHHAGDFTDLLGDGRIRSREGDEELFDLDLTYKVQTTAGGIAQVVGMAEDFASGEKLVVCLGDNIFQFAPVEATARFAEQRSGAMVFLKEVPPEHLIDFGVPRFEEGRIVDIIEKPSNPNYPKLNPGVAPPSPYAVTGLYCYDPAVFGFLHSLKPSGRGELEITDVNCAYAENGMLDHHILNGWWGDAGTADSLDQIGAWIKADGANNRLHLPTSPSRSRRKATNRRRTSAG